MSRSIILSVIVLVLIGTSVSADARRTRHRYPPGYWHEVERDHKNRRDARRAGLAAAIVVSGVTKAVASERIEQRYQDCLRDNGYYDIDCDRQRYADEARARQQARRRGLVAGVVTREVVRD